MIVVQTRTSNSPSAKSSITCSSMLLGHLAVADGEPAPRGTSSPQPRRRRPRCCRRGCGRSRPARRDRSRAGSPRGPGRRRPRRRRSGSAAASSGGVSITRHVADADQRHVQRARDRRRRQRQHVDLAPQLLQPLLVRDAEALLLVDDEQAQVLEARRPSDRIRCVPITMSTAAVGTPLDDLLAAPCALRKRREHLDLAPGTAPGAARKVLKCCCASTVVGTSTATCLPSCTALNAARSATSVLPKPTSPQTSRSIGRRRCMSALTSSIAARLVRRLGVRERLLQLALPGRVRR